MLWASTVGAESAKPSPETFEYTTPTEKNYLRAVLELEALTTVSVVWYVIDVRQGGEVGYRWQTFQKKLSGTAIGHDDNGFGTNFRGHGLGGNAYYLSARSNHLGIGESLGFAVAGALLWEYFGAHEPQELELGGPGMLVAERRRYEHRAPKTNPSSGAARLDEQLPSIAALSCSAVGCYTTTIRPGKPAAPAGIEYDEKWHHGLVWGIAELSGPYNMSRVCPQGWAVVKTETSFLNGLVSTVTDGVYSPQTVTVQCSAAAAPAIPMPDLGSPPSPPPAPPATPAAAAR